MIVVCVVALAGLRPPSSLLSSLLWAGCVVTAARSGRGIPVRRLLCRLWVGRALVARVGGHCARGEYTSSAQAFISVGTVTTRDASASKISKSRSFRQRNPLVCSRSGESAISAPGTRYWWFCAEARSGKSGSSP